MARGGLGHAYAKNKSMHGYHHLTSLVADEPGGALDGGQDMTEYTIEFGSKPCE